MPTTVILEIPDWMCRPLQRKADRKGKRIDQIVMEWLGDAVEKEEDDPLLRMAGAFSSDVTDAGTAHDFYIGEELGRTHD
jgi:hypothetical protein